MAKIIYFKDPVDESQVVEIISKGTLNHALKELGIEKDPLCVTINGMTPDDVDVETILDDTDIVEIRRMVHGGGGDSGTKSTLATVVQIAAIVAVTMTGVGAVAALAIMVGAQVVAGALNKWAQDLANANGPNTDVQDASIQTNDFSVSSASNKARPLAPITVPIGSHRYAPDLHADVYKSRYGMDYDANISTPFTGDFLPGIFPTNGATAADNNWAVMPANYIAPNLPRYEIKIAPYGFTKKMGSLTPEENLSIITSVKALYQNPTTMNYLYGVVSAYRITESYPLVIYHNDPLDPYFGRYNLFFVLARVEQNFSTSDKYNYIANIFAGVRPPGSNTPLLQFFFDGPYSEPTYLLKSIPSSTKPLPDNMPWNDTVDDKYTKLGAFLLSVNGGSYMSPKTLSYPVQRQVYDYALSSTKGGVGYSTQVMNFGIGDLVISDRKIGSVKVNQFEENIASYSPIDKDNLDQSRRWYIPGISFPNVEANFYTFLKRAPDKALTNENSPTPLINPIDTDQHNFVFFRGEIGQNVFSFGIYGRVYSTSSGGFSNNTTRVQAQWKFSGDDVWREYSYPIFTITNNNTQPIYVKYVMGPLEIPVGESGRIESEFIEVRIRKAVLDSVDNSGSNSAALSVVDVSFYREMRFFSSSESRINIPMNLEGVYVTSLLSDTSQTNNYTALVEAKCWVYDFNSDTWVWTTSRNPAFWFLFFARGGFLNESANGQYSYPYSPTHGWVNYPGHPDSTDHIFGGGYKDEEIDVDKILEWAYLCEQWGLSIDMVIRDDTSVSDVLERIANVGRASVTYNVGVLSVVIEDPDQVPTSMFGMGNIKAGSFGVEYSVGDPVRKVVAQFTNRSTWLSDEVEALVPYSDSDVLKEIKITFDGITEKANAQREANILAARQFYQRRIYSWETDFQGRTVKRGDLVYLSHDSTQYGFSGRVMDFVVENGVVVGLRSGSIIDSSVKYITVMAPDESMETYECSFDGNMIVFDEPYDLEDASFYVNKKEENPLSRFPKSIPEDFVFIADIKATTGKIVRISEVQALAEGDFKFTAVDEDPAMWAYEFDNVIPPESMDDSILIARVYNVGSMDLGNGQVEIFWELDGAERVEIINLNTGLPITANGNYSFSGGSVVLDLIQGVKYDLELRPLAFGQPYKENRETLTVWPL